MKRKLVKQGINALTVSLPAEWVKKHELKPGDEIEVIEEGGSLIIDRKAYSKIREISFNVKNNDVLRTLIGALYRAGYDEFTLNLENRIDLAEIHNLLEFFVGLEIKEFSSKRVTLKDIAPSTTKDYDFFINKLFVSNRAMAEDLITYFKGDEVDLKNLEEMRKSNLKSREYCMRSINKLGFCGVKTEEIYSFLLMLEKISSSFWHMGQYILNNNPKKSAILVDILEQLKSLIAKLHHVYTKQDYNMGVNEVISDRSNLRNEWFKGDRLFRLFKQKEVDPVILSLIMHARMNIISAMSRFLATIIKNEHFIPNK